MSKKTKAQPLTFQLKKVNQYDPVWVWPKKDFIAYKKIYGNRVNHWGAKTSLIATLLIPASATKIAGEFNFNRHRYGEYSSTLGKCRATSAKVLEIYNPASGEKRKVGYSEHDCHFKYEVGKTVVPKTPFGKSKIECCSGGIHFFITKEEAERYH